MRPRRLLAAPLAGLTMLLGGVALAACDTGDGREMQPAPTTPAPVTAAPQFDAGEIVLTLPGEDISDGAARIVAPWSDGAAIDAVFTCDGAGTAPVFELSAPADADNLAVTVVDDGGHVSLVVIGIPAGTERLDMAALPLGATIEVNSLGQRAYDPPCPDAAVTRTYTTTLHVLREPVEVLPDDSVIEIFAALGAAASSTATTSGVYTGLSA